MTDPGLDPADPSGAPAGAPAGADPSTAAAAGADPSGADPSGASRASGASGHLRIDRPADLDRLADLLVLLEGGEVLADDELPLARSDRAHVEGCALCRGELRLLTAADELTRDALALAADAPAPTLPADVAARLDATLAALTAPAAAAAAPQGPDPRAARRDAAASGAGPTRPDGALSGDGRGPTGVPAGAEADVVPLAPRRRPAPRLLQAAASVAILAVVAVGVATTGGLGLDGGADESGAVGGGATTELALPLPGLGPDYRTETLAEQGAALATSRPPVAARNGDDLAASAGPADGPATTTESAEGAVGVGGGADGPGAAGGVPAPGTAAAGSAAESTAQSVADALAPLRDPVRLTGCLAEVTQTPESEVAALDPVLDYATFEGRPALIVVVRGERTEVYAVGPGCRAGSAELLSFAATAAPG